MKKILFLVPLAILFYACKKDGVGSKPVVSFISYSTDSIGKNTDMLMITLNVKDGDGDIENLVNLAPIRNSRQDTPYIKRKMPGIGANKGSNVNAEVRVLLQSNDFVVGTVTPPKDSLRFGIYIVDNAGNISDTIYTPKIPFNRQ